MQNELQRGYKEDPSDIIKGPLPSAEDQTHILSRTCFYKENC